MSAALENPEEISENSENGINNAWESRHCLSKHYTTKTYWEVQIQNRKLIGPQRWAGHGQEEKKSQNLPGLESQSSSPQPSHYTDHYTKISAEELGLVE
jgi:hypothetical protein